ncbi:hypothetical protein [Duganella vulcania]|uniref:Uncharacterized protein n=1 Tax=Duganella vulcania TaxID=2692166 RepID=A0A845GQR0_9BURK|nr:hypothetical protein [Duganella vulcania]MYM95027.1 hypothetical protein [Duganella vulcania]
MKAAFLLALAATPAYPQPNSAGTGLLVARDQARMIVRWRPPAAVAGGARP